MTIHGYAADLAARIPAMAQDSAINNSYAIEREIAELFRELRDQANPELRSNAENELEGVRFALRGYSLVPDDCWIGDNTTDDKVLWLVRRLLGTEAQLNRCLEQAVAVAEEYLKECPDPMPKADAKRACGFILMAATNVH